MIRRAITTRRRLLALPLLVGLGAGGLGGCVSQQEYDSLFEAERAARDRNAELVAQLEASQSQIDGLRASTTGADRTMGQLREDNNLLRQQLRQAQDTIAGFEDRLGGLEFGGLDPTTDRALARLAEQHPDLLRYDSERGMLRFASDLTFASGSAEVRQQARASLDALARVLAIPEAQGYDIRIVGHTDSQPISAGTAQRHPTNTHLSVHRAISVRNALTNEGVDAPRIQVAGWGEFRPAVPNNPGGNTPENRRVEIYLVAATDRGPTEAGTERRTGVGVDREQPPGRAFDPTK